jgi:parallel beta-helix repeat protein
MKNVNRLVVVIAVVFLCGAAHAAVWYVHPDSTLNSIQTGIDSCSTGDTVLVGPGTYTENINFNGMAITVESELGPDSTIIDGSNPSHPDSGSVVLFANGEDTTSVLQGFTITNGSGTNFTGVGTIGGGILCFGSSSPTIAGNRITVNEAFWGGGGIASIYSSPVIDSNTIDNNVVDSVGGGIFIYYNSDATIINNSIKFNTTVYGGGICVTAAGAAPKIMNNEIAENTAIGSGGFGSGGGVAVGSSAAPYYHVNNIRNNTANYGGGGVYCYSNSTPLFVGDTITQNNAPNGAIRCRYNPAPSFRLCNISANNASGASILECTLTFDSCTISNNYYYGIQCAGGVDAVINWCNIYGHSGYGIYNGYASDTINAENNWWGDPSGPSGFGPGTGDPVSDYVDFDPWLTDSVQWVGVEEMPIVKPVETNENLRGTVFRGPLQLPEGKQCKVYDIMGRIVEPSRIKPGIYFIEVDGVVTQKVVKVR